MASDPHLRQSTWNLGRLNGGTVPNMAPAQASATVDHRTVGNQGELLHWWTSQPEIDALHTLIDLPAVWTPAETPWLGKADVSTLALLKAAAVKWLPCHHGFHLARRLAGAL